MGARCLGCFAAAVAILSLVLATGMAEDDVTYENLMRSVHKLRSAIKYLDDDIIGHCILEIPLPPAQASVDNNSYSVAPTIWQGDTATVKDLLEKGLDPNLVVDNHGLSPLNVASALGDKEMVEILIEYNADVHFRVTEMNSLLGHTPIHHAAGKGNAEIVQILLNHGANVNDKIPGRWRATDLYVTAGYSPIHFAVMEGHVNVLKVLIANGAELNNPVTDQKFMPLDLARIEESAAAIEILMEAGAKGNSRLRTSSSDNDGSILALILSILVSTLPVGYMYYTGGFTRKTKKKVPLKPKSR